MDPRTTELREVNEALQREVSARQRSQATVAEQSRVLEAFFQHGASPLALLDPEFNFLRVNAAYARACRRDAGTFPGHNHFDAFPDAETEARFREAVRSRRAQQGFSQRFLFPNQPDRSPTYWDWTLAPVLDDAGEVDFLIFALKDVTQRKLAEEALGEVARYARSLLEASLDPMVTISPDGKITDANQATERIAGRDRRQLVGSDFSQFFTEPDRAMLAYRRALAEGFITDYPLSVRHAEGRITHVLYNASIYRNEAGEVQGIFAAARDITQRLEAERSLWESEQRYRSLIQATTQIVWTTNARGDVEQDVPSWRAFTGQEMGEILGWRWLEAVHPADRPVVETRWRQAIAASALLEIEYRLRRHDRQYRVMFVRGVPVVEKDGTIREWIGTCADITEQRAAERELARYREQLEQRVAERTEELSRSNRELEQFAYIASHDLQEPLRAITAYLQLIERRYRDRLDAEGEQFIRYAVEGASRMQQLIADLLEYSRVGRRGRPLEPTDLEAVLTETLRGLQPVIEESGASITHDPLPVVHADRIQLVQVLQNLLSNAIKFRGARRPEIRVSASKEDGLWRLAVEDNGIGIEQQYWDQIFVIFQRLHPRQRFTGTGIGLAICKKIVERHGGRIWLESQPGQGSTFYFTLPVPAKES